MTTYEQDLKTSRETIEIAFKVTVTMAERPDEAECAYIRRKLAHAIEMQVSGGEGLTSPDCEIELIGYGIENLYEALKP